VTLGVRWPFNFATVGGSLNNLHCSLLKFAGRQANLYFRTYGLPEHFSAMLLARIMPTWNSPFHHSQTEAMIPRPGLSGRFAARAAGL